MAFALTGAPVLVAGQSDELCVPVAAVQLGGDLLVESIAALDLRVLDGGVEVAQNLRGSFDPGACPPLPRSPWSDRAAHLAVGRVGGVLETNTPRKPLRMSK